LSETVVPKSFNPDLARDNIPGKGSEFTLESTQGEWLSLDCKEIMG
jgi:hypothetical protein